MFCLQTWNDDLAQLATDWAENCYYGSHAHVQSDLVDYGQNVAGAVQSDPNLSGLMDLWFWQISYYDYDTNTCTGYPCQSYLQVHK